MIDEKYRRNPENITDFLKKERFRYISKMEFEFEDEKYNEIELCDVVLEMIKSFTDETGEYFIYKIEEKNHQYDVPYLKEKILEGIDNFREEYEQTDDITFVILKSAR